MKSSSVEWYSGVGATNAAKIVGDFEKKAKWNGTIGEYAEEVAGNIENALLVGDNTLDAADDTGVFNKEQNLDTFLGVALMGGFFSAVKTASYRGPKREALNEMSRAGKVMDEALSGNYAMREKWGEWRNRLLVGTDEEKKATLREVMDDTELPMSVRMGVLNFSKAAQKYEGIARAQESKVNEGEQDPVAQAYDESYDKGYEATGTQDMNDVRMSLDMKRAQLAQVLGMENADDIDAVVGDPLQYVQSKTGDMNVMQRIAAVDYANAKSAYDGMVARINDDADDMAEQKRETARKMENADGMIRPAVMKETDDEGHNKVVYVVDGTVVMTDDGSMVDKTKSDNSVVVYNPETGKRQIIDPGADTGILSLGATTSAADYDAMIGRDREQYVQEQMDEAQGKVRLVPGMQIVLPTGEPAVVMAMDGDEVTVGLDDGKQTSVQLSDLQRISDEKALADYNQRHGIEPEQAGEQIQGEGQEEAPTLSQETAQGDAAQGGVVAGAPAEFAPDMELTVRDESGTEKPAMVMGRVRYENGSFVPDENGSIIEYYVDGEVKHDHEDKLRDKVVNHVVAEPDGNSLPQYGVNDIFTLRDAEGDAVNGEVQGISEDGVEIRTDAPVNGKRVQVIPADVFENMVETLHDADGNTVWERNPAVGENGESVPETGMNVPENGENAPENGTNGADKADIGKADVSDGADNAVGETAGNDMEGNAGEADAVQPMPMLDNGEEDWHSATPERAHQYIYNEAGLSRSEGNQFVTANVDAAQKALSKAKAAQMPQVGTSIQKYNQAKAKRQEKIDEAQREVDYWNGVRDIQNGIQKEEDERRAAADAVRHDEAVAQIAEGKRVKAEKEAEQEAVGAHAANPKIKEKWDKAKKVEGNAYVLTLADGSTLPGHYVLTEAGAASASHDAANSFEPTDGFPVDENGESVNDRDYRRDKDAQRIVYDIAHHYDSRALQTPVVVSKDGVVLSGNNRTMSGEIAARQGTDNMYVEHLKKYGTMYGFTPEQVEGMKNPRVVFVPDEDMTYDAKTFARFNAETQKKQSKPELAVKLGKTVPDKTFASIASTIGRYDRLSDFYADEKAVNGVLGELYDAGAINGMQMPELRTGNTVSAVGRELIENTLIGKVFQASPDAVRQIIATPTLRQSIMMALNEIAHNRTLADSGYDLGKELGAAVDLVARAKAEEPDVYKEGVPVSPYGRQQGLFDEELGESRVTDVVTLLLADVLNSNKPSDLRKVIATYNADATSAAAGQMDMFSGDVRSKEQLLNDINEHFRNATPKELQERVDAAIAERKRNAEGGRGETVEQGKDAAGRNGGSRNTDIAVR